MKRIKGHIKVLWLPWLIAAFVLSGCGRADTPISATSSSRLETASPTFHLEADKRIVGYYAHWAADQGFFVSKISADKITHIIYSSAHVSAAGECALADPAADIERIYTAGQSVNGQDDLSEDGAFHGNFNQMRELKLKYPRLKILISIFDGEGSENLSKAAQSDSSRKIFVKSCIALFFSQYPGVFDGIDVDWEYPVFSSHTTTPRPEDRHNFTLLLAELRRQLDELGNPSGAHYLLTIAAGSGADMDKHYERSEIVQYLDWINLMTYDLHGAWDAMTNFNAPLYRAAGDPGSPSLNADAVVRGYLAAGVPADKLMLGVPFFGRAWKGVGSANDGLYQSGDGPYKGGALTYREIVTEYLPTYTRYWDREAQVPWLYNSTTGVFISYDDPDSIAAKAKYAKDNHLAGVMIWELSQGNDKMLEAIQEGFQSSSVPRK